MSGKILRPYQIAAIEGCIAAFRKGHRRVVVQLPTGAGKTLTAARMIAACRGRGKTAVFTAPAIALVDQTLAAFEAEGIGHIGVMQASHPRTDRSAPVQIASVQTLRQRELPEAALVIVDECHIRADAVERLMAERPDAYFVGLSATPWAKGMGLLWQDLITPVSIGDLIDQGVLSRFVAYAPEDPDLTGVKKRGGEYVEGSLFDAMATPQRIAATVETWLDRAHDRPTLAFCVNRAHAALMEAEFRRRRVAVGYVDGDTPMWERESMATAFRRGQMQVICSVRTMTTGVDLPVSCIVDAAPTTSEMLHVQKIGRGLRVNPGTEDCLILDFAGNSLRLGLVTDIHHDRLDTTPPDEKAPARSVTRPAMCVDCGVLSSKPICPSCGLAHPVREALPAPEKLVQVTASAPVDPLDEKAIWYSGLQFIAAQRRYRPSWAKASFHERFGVWPSFTRHVAPAPPAPEVEAWVRSKIVAFARAKGGHRHAR